MEFQTETYVMLTALTDCARREQVARALAERLGAEALLVFIKDREIDVLLPAPGFTQTLPQGRVWRAFLEQCVQNGRHRTVVPFPSVNDQCAAFGITASDGSVLVLLGGEPNSAEAENVCVLLPLLAAALRGEQIALSAEGAANAARQSAAQARTLASALDAARRELQTALLELHRLNDELEERVNERTLELQSAMQQLRSLSAHLQTAREEERTSIAREIHDELGQQLTALKMDLRMAARKTASAVEPDAARAEIDAEFDDMTELVDQIIDTVRNITRELRPEMIEDLGLKSAIEWHVQEFQQHTGIQCITEIDPLELDRQSAMAIFRIVQESLTNVARHANASRVHINLRRENPNIMLEVRDNGRGVTSNELVNSRSFGVLGMRERVLLLDGEFKISSEPGKGTTVSAAIPL